MNLPRALRLLASSALVVAAGLLPLASRAITVDPDAAIAATRAPGIAETIPVEDANALISPARSEDVLWHRLVVLGADGSLMPGVLDTLRTLRDSGAHSRETTVMALDPLGMTGYEGQKAVDLARAFLEKRPVAWEFVDVDGERRAQAEALMAQGMDPDEAAWRADNDRSRAFGTPGQPVAGMPDGMPDVHAVDSGAILLDGVVDVDLKDTLPSPNAICRNCPQYDGILTPSSVYRTVAGSLGTGDCKTYRMTVRAGRAYRATFCEGGGAAAFDTALEVKNGTCSVIASNDDFCAGGKSQVDFSSSANGYVFIKVFSQSGAGGSFVMAYRETGAAQQGCVSCPNFDYGVFTPNTNWQTHSSTLAAGSCRMYKFALLPNRAYTFTFCQGGGTADFDTRIETFFNNCVAGPFNEDACAGGLSEVIVNSNTSQYFYVRVAGAVVGTGNYTLAYREAPITCKTCPDYDYGAFTPTSSEQLHAGSMMANGCRVYAFNLSVGVVYRFSLCTNPLAPVVPTNGSATFDSTLEILSPACASAMTNDNACGDDAEIIFAPAASGVHHLRVGTAGPSGSYVLSYVALVGGGTCLACPSSDATLGAPTPAYQTVSDTLTLPGECRVYRVPLVADFLYEFTLCAPDGSAVFDSTLKIQDLICANVGTINNNACGDDARGTVIPVFTEDHFVTVGAAAGGTGAYTLAYRQVPVQCSVCPAFDATIVPTTSYQTVSGNFAQRNDCRLYEVVLTAGLTYEFTLCAGGGFANFDSMLQLQDSACGMPVQVLDTCGDDAAFTFTSPASGTYYVRLASQSGQGSFALAYRQVPIVCPLCPAFTADVPAPTLAYQNVFGSLDVGGDCRIYRVPLVANNQYEFTFCAGGGAAPFDSLLAAQSPACALLALGDDQCGDDAQIAFIPTTTGNHYIRVAEFFGTGTGAFSLAYRMLPPPCTICPASDATLLAPTPAYQTMASSLTVAGECKVFDVPLLAGRTYEFTFCDGGGSALTFDSVLALGNAACGSVGTVTSDACGDDDRAVVVAAADETHYVTVSANAGGVGAFTLAYREVAVTCPVCPATSGALLAPTTTYQLQSGSLDAAGDCRIYSVALFAGKAYDFTFCAGGATAPFDSVLNLLDILCVDTGLAVADACGDDDEATIVVTITGTYYVRVAANADGIGAFDLAYREVPVTCPACPAFDQAIPAPTPVFQTVSDTLVAPGDCRILQVPLVAGDTYQFTFCDGGASAAFDTTLSAADPACAIVAGNDDTCGLASEIIFVAPTTGDHYIRVGSFGDQYAGTFTLAYRQIPVTCLTCPASDAVLPAPTLACQTQVGSLDAAGDCRIYEVPLVAGTAYEFTFCSTNCPTAFADFDSSLTIHDAACLPVGASVDDACGDDAQATLVAGATGTYYVRVAANANGFGDFQLAWRELAPTCTTCPAATGVLPAPTNPYQTQPGTLDVPGDCDSYDVALVMGRTYEFTFCAGSGSAAFDSALELSNAACAPVGAPNNASCGDDARIVYQAAATETHHIRVYAEDGSTGPYVLAYREVPAQCTACPGFDAVLPTPTPTYQTASGTFVTGGDCRVYRVPLTVGRTYEFTFCAGGGSADFDSALQALSPTCVNVGTVSNDECGDDARAIVVATTTGFHRVAVSSQDDSIGNFTLAFRQIPQTCLTCPASDAVLPAPTGAYQTISHSLDAAGDCRIFKVPLIACQNYEFTFCAGGGSAEFDSAIGLRNPSCAPAGVSVDNACGDDASATMLANVTGDHYVRVSANAGGIGDFTLAWRIAPNVACTQCPASDDTLLAPTPAYQTASGNLTDGGGCVLYEVPLTSGLTYEFTFCDGGGTAPFDSALEIHDAGCSVVGIATNDACGDDAQATVTAAATETHYVRVSSTDCGTGPFTLAYRQLLPTCATCPDSDDTLANPTVTQQTISDSLVVPGDCKVYRVALTAGSTYGFTLCGPAGSADFDSALVVWDPSCAQVGIGDDDACGDDATASHVALETAFHYVKVYSSNNGTGSFTLAWYEIPVTCGACPASDGTLAAPTLAYQQQAGSLDAAGDCRIYDVPLTAGFAYEFTFCDPDSCCVAHDTPSCDDPACSAAVCAVDSFCCNVQWDNLCASQALSMCGGCPASGPAFDSELEVHSAGCTPVGDANGDACGDDATVIVLATATETHYVRASANGDGIGPFVLYYRQLEQSCTSCPTSVNTLAPPTNLSYQTESGTIAVPGDCVTYDVALEAGKTYEFTFCAGGGSADFDSALRLTDAACAEVGTPANDACVDDAELIYTATATETHYVNVRAEDDSTGDFTLAYREVPGACVDCPSFDDTLAAPTPAVQTISDTIAASGDCFVYRVPLTAGETYRFTLCGPDGSADFDSYIDLMGPGCGGVGIDHGDECGDDAEGTVVADTTDFYYVKVYSQVGGTGAFTLAYFQIPVTCVTCPSFNEGLFAPTTNYQYISDSLDAAGDCRVYQVPLEECTQYVFTFCDLGAGSDFDSVIQLMDASCAPVGTSIDDSCNGDNAHAFIIQTTTGDHYVRVSANGNETGDFTLGYRKFAAACTACPSSDAALSAPTTTYQTASGSLASGGDCYLYSVTLTAGTEYEFSFCDGGGSADFDSVLQIQDSSCAAAGSSIDDACGDDAEATITAGSTDVYYIRVSANSCGTGAYTLAYREVPVPVCPACPSFTAAPPAMTTSFQTVAGSLDTETDCRIYEFALVAGERYEFSLCTANGGSAAFDSMLELANAGCAIVGTPSNDACDGDDAYLSYYAASTGNHYIRVSAASGLGAFTLAYRQDQLTGAGGYECGSLAPADCDGAAGAATGIVLSNGSPAVLSAPFTLDPGECQLFSATGGSAGQTYRTAVCAASIVGSGFTSGSTTLNLEVRNAVEACTLIGSDSAGCSGSLPVVSGFVGGTNRLFIVTNTGSTTATMRLGVQRN